MKALAVAILTLTVACGAEADSVETPAMTPALARTYIADAPDFTMTTEQAAAVATVSDDVRALTGLTVPPVAGLSIMPATRLETRQNRPLYGMSMLKPEGAYVWLAAVDRNTGKASDCLYTTSLYHELLHMTLEAHTGDADENHTRAEWSTVADFLSTASELCK